MVFEGIEVNDAVFVVLVFLAAVIISNVLKRYVVKWFKNLAKETKTKIDDIIINEFGNAVVWLVYIAAAYIAVTYFTVVPGLKEIAIALGVLILGRAVVNTFTGLFKEYVDLLPLEEDQKNLFLGMERAVKVVLYTIVVLVMLASVGIDVWPIITSLGIGGLAISMALKDVLTDYISGIIVVVGRSLKKGDRVLIKDKGVEGVVEEIGWRYTVLKTDNGEIVTVPNRVVSSSVIIFK